MTAPRRVGRPRDVDSAETRARLLTEARRHFAQYGYAGTTNRALADAAGLTTGAIYHYYPSQIDLYVAVYAEVQEVIFERFEKATASRSGYVERLHAILDAGVQLSREDTSIGGFVMSAAADIGRHPELAAALGPVRARSAQFLHRTIAEAKAAGELHASVDAAALEDLLVSVLNGLALFVNTTGDADRHAAAVDVLKLTISATMRR